MSKRLLPTDSTAYVALCAAAASLPFPPATGTVAFVPDGWSTEGAGTVPQFDLDISSTGALDFTGGELWAGKLRALVIADTQIDSVTHATETINEAGHGLLTGDGPIRLTTSGTLPTGLALATDYWVIKTGAGTFKLAASLEDALAGTAVAFSDAGTGNHTYSDTTATSRVVFHSLGLLTATIALDVQKAWSRRIEHSNCVVCYALTGTLSAGTVDARIIPVQER